MKKLLSILIGFSALIGITSCSSDGEKFINFRHTHVTAHDFAKEIFDGVIDAIDTNKTDLVWASSTDKFKTEIVNDLNNISQIIYPKNSVITVNECSVDTKKIISCEETTAEATVKIELLLKDNPKPTIISIRHTVVYKNGETHQTIMSGKFNEFAAEISTTFLIKLQSSTYKVGKVEFYSIYSGEQIDADTEVQTWFKLHHLLFQLFAKDYLSVS